MTKEARKEAFKEWFGTVMEEQEKRMVRLMKKVFSSTTQELNQRMDNIESTNNERD